MRTASFLDPLKRSQAGGGTLQPPALPSLDDLEALRQRVAVLEEELAILKGNQKKSAESITDDWLYSPESIAAYKYAIKRFARYHDRRALDEYCRKTGGRVPRLANNERRAS
jgi:hypothetical protein